MRIRSFSPRLALTRDPATDADRDRDGRRLQRLSWRRSRHRRMSMRARNTRHDTHPRGRRSEIARPQISLRPVLWEFAREADRRQGWEAPAFRVRSARGGFLSRAWRCPGLPPKRYCADDRIEN